jgi:hypothetical protein
VQANVATLFVAALEKPNLYLQVRYMLLLHGVQLVLPARRTTALRLITITVMLFIHCDAFLLFVSCVACRT